MFAFDTSTGEIFIYDDIGPEWMGMIDTGAVLNALAAIGDKRVTVRLNTPGGSVDEGVAIFNALKRHKAGVDTVVDSLAASMGSYLMLAGEKRTIAQNAMVMVHYPWTIALGNSIELRSTADMLDKYTDRKLHDFVSVTGQSEEQIREWMEAETWFTAAEAVEAGFVQGIEGEAVEPVEVAAGRFRHTPQDILTPAAAGTRTPYPVHRERARLLSQI